MAVGAGFLAQTGIFGNSSASTEEDDTEYINTGSHDYESYAVAQWPAYIVLPAQYDSTRFAAATAAYLKPADGALVQKTTVIWTFEDAARYAWMREWLDADTRSDRPAAARAADMLTEAASWPATVRADGGGVVDHFSDVARAARDGDRATVQDDALRYADDDQAILEQAR
ncbi:hypothetical protein [Pseudoclavibacter sp. 13-3]|uniref:hypothetical protein n=1 Tax=Pseudoclavibacter sp. 13-3 TaxID=2901228 RepID=UPI001E4C7D0D|nr:hypothetical protein [Pseudoclavibacter sp. 13-3]MCD7101042.1 hypothetical protein [Pseudoclavibacter sp. 13-3]